MKRTIKLNGIDKELNLVKVAVVKMEHNKKEFIYLEKIDEDSDGWRLVYTEKTIPDITKLINMEIIRDE